MPGLCLVSELDSSCCECRMLNIRASVGVPLSCLPQEAHALSFAIMEVPWLALLVLIVITPFFFMVGMDPQSGRFYFFFCFVVFLVGYIFISLGMLAGALFPTAAVAQTVVGIVIPLTFLFGGLYLPYPSLPIYWCGAVVRIQCSSQHQPCPATTALSLEDRAASSSPRKFQEVGLPRGPDLLRHPVARSGPLPAAERLRRAHRARVAPAAGSRLLPVHPGH